MIARRRPIAGEFRINRIVPAALVFLLCACASVDRASKIVDKVDLAPYANHLACLHAQQGARIEYRFQSNEPVKFDLRYSDGGATLLPITREWVLEDAGIYPVAFTHEFCLAWEAGPAGAGLAYRWRVRPPS
jgi:hypothetical protein